MVQDFGVFRTLVRILYYISIIILSGLKIILIVHLIFRGFWTGLVGLSYVFPKGVNKRNLSESDRKLEFDKPEYYVLKLEKICSLLFSFIFSTFTFFYGNILLFMVIVLFFMFGIDLGYVRIITLSFIALFMLFSAVFLIFFRKKFNQSKYKKRMGKSVFTFMLPMYFSNIGKFKILAIYTVYFLFIIFLNINEFKKFNAFDNSKGIKFNNQTEVISLDKEHYNSTRNEKLRHGRAFINDFRIEDDRLDLFISFYKRDIFTAELFNDNPEIVKKAAVNYYQSEKFNMSDLYEITIDDSLVTSLKWYSTTLQYTDQKGLITSIPLDDYSDGYHELRINKLYWKISRKELEIIENWDVIPFEIKGKT